MCEKEGEMRGVEVGEVGRIRGGKKKEIREVK